MRRFLALIGLVAMVAAAAYVWQALDQPVRVVKVEGQISETEAAESNAVSAKR